MKAQVYLVSLVMCAYVSLVQPSGFSRQTKKISKHLEGKVQTEDIEDNLAEARSLLVLELKRENSRSLFRRKSTKLDALKSFIALERALPDETPCDQSSHEVILGASSIISDGGKTALDIGSVRYERIVKEVALRHALRCLPQYPFIFQEIYSAMDLELVSKVNIFFRKGLQHGQVSKISLRTTPSSAVILDPHLFESRVGARVLYQTLIQLGKYDNVNVNAIKCKDTRLAMRGCEPFDAEGAKKVLTDHLIYPCEYLMKELSGIFRLVEMDLRAAEKREVEDPQLNLGYSHYKLCESLLESNRSSVLEHFIELVTVIRDTEKNRL